MSEQFTGNVEIRDSVTNLLVIEIDGDEGGISAGGHGEQGHIFLYREDGDLTILDQRTVTIDGQNANLVMGGNQADGDIYLESRDGRNRIRLDADVADINLGGHGANGNLLLYHEFGDNITLEQSSVHLDGKNAIVRAGGNLTWGSVILRGSDGEDRIRLKTIDSTIHLGGHGAYGRLFVYPSNGDNHVTDEATIYLDGNAGDIVLRNGDCAEDFDVTDGVELEPGSVVVMNSDGRLQQSTKAYDKKVAGVVSGAGNCKPGIILDRQKDLNARLPVALTGKVFCKVDSQYAPIEVGDLLTTSPTPGHAMKAEDPIRAFGAVIGKALRPLAEGSGLIPMLVALQ